MIDTFRNSLKSIKYNMFQQMLEVKEWKKFLKLIYFSGKQDKINCREQK